MEVRGQGHVQGDEKGMTETEAGAKAEEGLSPGPTLLPQDFAA